MSFNNSTIIFENNSLTAEQAQQHPLKKPLEISLLTLVLVIMFAMGCTIAIKEVLVHLRRPVGILIGMLSQFVILPLCSFGLIHAIGLSPYAAIGMLVLSCCPGGTMSNLFTYWTDGDVPLSITMTTCSTILAFGMMPLNLWIYSRSWVSDDLQIPYIKISITLASILGPVAAGIICRKLSKKIASILSKVGSIVGMLGIAVSLIMQSIIFPKMYSSPWSVWLAAACLPPIGLSIGFALSKITRRPMKVCKAIAFETGSQNVALAMTVLFLTFPYKVLAEAVAFPQLYAIIMLSQYGLFCACYNIYIRIFKPKDDEEINEKSKENTADIKENNVKNTKMIQESNGNEEKIEHETSI